MNQEFLVAKTCHGFNEFGTKRPMYMDCIGGDELSSWLVKVGRPGMIDERHLCAEIVSATLIQGLGLLVADHRTVVLDSPYLEGINSTLEALGGQQVTPGWGVAAALQEGAQSLADGVSYGKSHRPDASVLYAFDLMATHYDRSPGNPNCGTVNGRLFVYDFDQCFPDLTEPTPLFGSRKPWEVAHVAWRDLHIFHRQLRKVGLDKDAVSGAFSAWTDSWWDGNRPRIPVEWTSVADAIWSQAVQVVPNLDQFIHEVEQSLI